MNRNAFVTKLCVLALSASLALGAAFPGGAAAGASAGEGNVPAALTVMIDGPKRLKVARKLRFKYSCSIDCTARVRSQLVMPGGTFENEGTQPILGGQVWERILTLSFSTRNYLKANFKRSKLRITVIADASDTGERVVAHRVFRFKK